MSTPQPPGLRIVESRLTMEYFPDDAVQTRSLGVTLSYDPTDPFAVTVAMHAEPFPVSWTFARELLVDGTFEPTGAGDVVVWPSLNEAGHAVVVLNLSSPRGEFLGQIHTQDLLAFVREMLTMVPTGEESGLLDLDTAVEQLLDHQTRGGSGPA